MIYRLTPGGWEQLPGRMRQVSVASDGTVYGVSGSGGVCRFVSGAWEHIAVNLRQASVGQAGLLWGVDADGQVLCGTALASTSPTPTHAWRCDASSRCLPGTLSAFPTSAPGSGTPGWRPLGIAFVAHSTPQPGTVPIYLETPDSGGGPQTQLWHRGAAQAKAAAGCRAASPSTPCIRRPGPCRCIAKSGTATPTSPPGVAPPPPPRALCKPTWRSTPIRPTQSDRSRCAFGARKLAAAVAADRFSLTGGSVAYPNYPHEGGLVIPTNVSSNHIRNGEPAIPFILPNFEQDAYTPFAKILPNVKLPKFSLQFSWPRK